MITIDTESTLYVCTDGTNAEVHILFPRRGMQLTGTALSSAPKRTTLAEAIAGITTSSFQHIENLRLDDPDPYGPNGNDAAVFKLLCESDMEHHTFDI